MSEIKIPNAKQFLVFKLNKEEYGIDITKITTIIEKDMRIVRVPETPDFISGVINLRGEIIPIMDLGKRLNLPHNEDTENTRVIIIKIDDIVVGFIVDSVIEVLWLGEDEIKNVANFSNDLSMDFIYGAGKIEGRIITILKIDRLISL